MTSEPQPEPDWAGLELSPDPVVVVDRTEVVVHANRLAVRLIAAGPDLVGCKAAEVLRLRDQTGRDWWRAAEPLAGDARLQARLPEQELQLQRPDGRTRAVAVTGLRLPDTDRSARLLVLSIRAGETRSRRDRARNDLVSTVSHELRSPLTSVKGFTKTLLAKWERFTDEQRRQMLAVVNEDADRVTRLLGELLDVSRIDAGRLQVARRMVDAGEVAARVADRLGGEDDELPRAITIAIGGAVPPLYADPDKLEQVFTNLIENALKYTDGAITVSAGVDGGAVRFTVADDGPGMADSELDRIFTKFWRRPGERRHGTGLGLYITRGLVEAHGGEVWAESEPDGGSQLHFTLPLGGLELAGIDTARPPRPTDPRTFP